MFDVNQFAESLRSIPPEIATMIIGMIPIFELRGAIPVAIGVYEMSIPSSLFWSVLGNMIPPIFFIYFLESIANFLSKKFSFFEKFFEWLFARTKRKAHDKIEKYGHWGLFFLVAIPLPVTGGWTGALAAFLFGIERRKSIPVIFLGIVVAGIIVSVLTVGVTAIF